MSADGLAPQGLYDTDAALIAPEWFEDFSGGDVPRHVNAPSLATEGKLAPGDDVVTIDDADQHDWIVQFDTNALDGITSAEQTAGLLTTGEVDFEIVRGLGLSGLVLLRSSGAEVDPVESWLAGQASVADYELDVIHQTQATPDDPSYSALWGMENNGQTGGTPDADIDVAAAWDISTGSSSIVVGVIDTGVDYTHVDLAANIWTNPGEIAGNGIDDDGNGFVDDVHGYDFINNDGDPMDDHGHGTHVAGTIAAAGDNGRGVVGVNWSSSIMALKFLSGSGRGYLSDAVRAINYATMMRTMYDVNVRITSNSWGGGGYSFAMASSIAASNDAGIMFVAAAGNSRSNNDASPHYPSSYNAPNVVAVAATDHNDNLAWFSSYGATTVDLAAPGVSTYSTVPGNDYDWFSGTSMATPHVSGVAALAWSVAPDASVAEIKNVLLQGTDPLASLSGKVLTGGRLNAYNTLQLLPRGPSIASLSATPQLVEPGMSVTLTAEGVTASDGAVAAVHFYQDTNDNGLFDDDDLDLGRDTTIVGSVARLTLDTTNLNVGTHTFFARAVDDQLLWGSSASTTVTVIVADDHGDDASSATPVALAVPTVILDGNVLTIDPVEGFLGEFRVIVTVSDGTNSVGDEFDLIVGNSAPVVQPIGNRTMPRTQDTLAIVLQATDADADELTYAATVVTPGMDDVTLSLVGNLLTIDPADGFLGQFKVSVAVSDGIVASGETFTVSVINAAPVLQPIDDRSMPHAEDTMTVVLDATDADGDQLTYTAEVLQTDPQAELAYQLDQQLGLHLQTSYYENARGMGEKYLQADDGDWYYVLPNGELYRWGGSIESSTLVATLDAAYHADPTRLYEAQMPTPEAMPLAEQSDVTLSLVGNVLTIDPADGFAGRFQVRVMVSDGIAADSQTFDVAVTNSAPVLQPIGDRVMSHAEDTITIVLAAADADGLDQETLSYAAEFVAPGSDDATLSLVGNVLTIDPVDGFAGQLQVNVTVDDGAATVGETFRVSVTNAAPELEPIGDRTMSHLEDTITVRLAATDVDGDPLTYTAQLVVIDPLVDLAFDLDRQLGLSSEADEYENVRGLGEKYLQDEAGAWYYILPNGELYRWGGSVESSTLVATLDAAYHADPRLLYEAQSPMSMAVSPSGAGDATLSLTGNLLTIDPVDGFTGDFHVYVTVGDGIATAGETFMVSVVNSAPVLGSIGERTMPHTQDTMTIILAAEDEDGDQLAYTAELVAADSDNVTLSLAGNVLSIDPRDGFAGEFQVRVTVSDGLVENTVGETFRVSVVNALPVLEPIGERTMPHTQDTMTIELAATDADGDPLSYTAELVTPDPDPFLGQYVTLGLAGNVLSIDPASGYTGEFQVNVTVSDGIDTVGETFRVSVVNAVAVLEPIGERTMPHTQDTMTIVLAATDADGDRLTYTAEAVNSDPLAELAYELDQQLGLVYEATPYENYFGRGEKYLVAGDGTWYFILQSGALYRFSGGIDSSTLVGTLDATYHAEASLLYNAQPPSPSGNDNATLSLVGNVLTIDPVDGFIGQFEVHVTVSDGLDTVGETFQVSVVNSVAVLEPIGSRTMSHSEDSISVSLAATDADGDQLTYAAQLWEATPSATADAPTLSLADGVLTIDPADGYVGQFQVKVTVSDGIDTVGETFSVSVENAAPVLEPIGHRTMSHTEDTITIDLAATDADGDTLSYTAELLGSGQDHATLSLTGLDQNVLSVDPADAFAGEFYVRVTVGDGIATTGETFRVEVVNAAPVLQLIGNRTMSHTEDTIAIDLAATDADGDGLTYAAEFISPGQDVATLSLAGQVLTIDPAEGYVGSLYVHLTVSDGIATVGETFRLAVTNSAPMLEPIGHRSMSHTEDTMSITLAAADADSDDLTYTAELLTSGQQYATLSLAGNVLTIDPADGYAGRFYARVTVSDGIATVGETFQVAVVNATPVLEPVGNQTMSHTEDTMSVTLAATDADSDELTYTAELSDSDQQHATLSLVGNVLTIDPADGYAGSLYVRTTVSDGIATVVDSFRVSVVNAIPVLQRIGNRTMSHNEDTMTITLAATDADGLDQNDLGYAAEFLLDGQDHATLSLVDNVLTLDPADGFAGSFYVRVAVTDGIATVGETFRVSVLNSAPQLEPVGARSMSHTEDTMSITLAAADADSDELTYTAELLESSRQYATLSLVGKALTIDPMEGYAGSLYVRVAVTDGIATAGETFRVSVLNSAPQLESIGYRTMSHTEDTTSIALAATDADGDDLTYAAEFLSDGQDHATLSLLDNVLTIDPADGYAGSFYVRATVSDGVATVGETFRVSVVNAVAVLEPIGNRTMPHTQDTMTIALAATDADGDDLTYAAELLLDGQDHATLSLAGNVLTIDPADGYAGSLHVRATVSDGVATIGETFLVSVVNAVPILEPIGNRTMSHREDSIDIALAATDADGDELTYAAELLLIGQDHATLSLTDHVLSVDPADGFIGSFYVRVSVTDGIDQLGETFRVSVVNSAPVLESIGDRTMSHNEDKIKVALTTSDADGDRLSYAAELVTPGMDNVALSLVDDILTIDPADGFAGRFDVRLSVTDGIATVGETFQVTVVNSAPVLEPIGGRTMSHNENWITVALAASDADGDQLSLRAQLVTPGQDNVSLSLVGNTLTIDPADGFAGQFDVRLSVTDGIATVGETFQVTVVNSAPVLQPIGSRSMPHTEGSIDVALAATDADGDPLSYSAELVTPDPQNVTLSLVGQVLTIDPADGFTGQFQVRVTVTDGIATTGETFQISVVNAAPVLDSIGNRSMSHTEGSIDVALAATDADGDPLGYAAELVTPDPQNVTLSLVGQVLTIDPADGFTGQFQVRVTVTDGVATTGETFQVSVLNAAPVLDSIGDRSMSHNVDSIDLALAATDADGSLENPLSYAAELVTPDQDDVVLSLNGRTLTIDPAEGFTGQFQVRVTVTDGIATDDETFQVSVVNSAPILDPIDDRDMSHNDDSTTIVLVATDPDGDGLTYTVVLHQDNVVDGVIGLEGDRDWFAFSAVTGATYRLYTELVGLPNSVLSLYGRDGTTLLERDHDGGTGLASSITWTPDADGTYYLAVEAAIGAAGGAYRVHFDVQSGDSATVPGATVPAVVSMLDPAVDQAAGHSVRYDGNRMTIVGSAGNDEFGFDAQTHRVTVNGIGYAFDPAVITSISIDGGGGEDAADIAGSAGNDLFTTRSNTATLEGSGYQLRITNTAVINAVGGGGSDVAKLFDSPGDDLFVATPHYGALYSDGFAAQANGFDGVHSYATAGGNDVAKMYDSPGDDNFYSSPDEGALWGAGFYNRAKNFEAVHAFATAGGTDQADLHDSAGDDRFFASPEEAALWGAGFYGRAKHFEKVRAHADAGGNDTADLYDSAGDDNFVATPTFAELSGDGFSNQVNRFDAVHAHSTAGGLDVAKLYDSPGNDVYHSNPNYGALTGEGFFNEARGFDGVHGYSTAGGLDVAKLFDSAGDDTFYASPSEASLYGPGFYNRVKHFAGVHAYSTGGGNDSARLYDSAGDDTLVSKPDESALFGEGFYNRAKYFEQVHAHADAGGVDQAILYDSAGDDLLEAAADWTRIAYGESSVQSSNFQHVRAVSTAGGTDTKHIQAIDFILEVESPWMDR